MRIMRIPALAGCVLALLSAPSCVSNKRFTALEDRVDSLSTQLASATADADNDGVVDSRDLEPRTPGDVEVDRFGRTVVEKKQPVYQPTTQPTTTNPMPQTPPTNSMGVPVNPNPTTTKPDDMPGRQPEKVEPKGDDDEGGAGNYHTVAKGDTLFSLARRYGTTVQAIRQLNGMSDNKIEVGQRLRVQ